MKRDEQVSDHAKRYRVIVVWSDEDDAYLASPVRWPSLMTHGSTPGRAVEECYRVIALAIEDCIEHQDPFPKPMTHDLGQPPVAGEWAELAVTDVIRAHASSDAYERNRTSTANMAARVRHLFGHLAAHYETDTGRLALVVRLKTLIWCHNQLGEPAFRMERSDRDGPRLFWRPHAKAPFREEAGRDRV